jgi:O-antigen ligase
VIIWNRFTEETMKQPLVGVGAGMAYWNPASRKPMPGEQFPRYSRDVHCVYLQIWYELGVIGAALFALLGLAILQRIQRMPHNIIPYAHGAFASAAATIASSYGLWRPWFNLMFVLGVVAFAIGLRALLRKQYLLWRSPDV